MIEKFESHLYIWIIFCGQLFIFEWRMKRLVTILDSRYPNFYKRKRPSNYDLIDLIGWTERCYKYINKNIYSF